MSRREKYLDSISKLAVKSNLVSDDQEHLDSSADDFLSEEVKNFDWFNFKSTAPDKPFKPTYKHVAGAEISDKERKYRFISSLSSTCISCSMCNLGTNLAEQGGIKRDPHILSNKIICNVMFVDFRPEWQDLSENQVMSTACPTNRISQKYAWLDFNNIYYTYMVKCGGSLVAGEDNIEACSHFLNMEIKMIMPKLILATGGVYSMISEKHIRAVNVDDLNDKKKSIVKKIIEGY